MTADEWWAARRSPHNRALLIAGLVALVCYLAAFDVRCVSVPGGRVTLFTLGSQAIGYMVAMGIANVCFTFGKWSELVIHPLDSQRYRERIYRVGLWFSVALPFSVPLLVLWRGCGTPPDAT